MVTNKITNLEEWKTYYMIGSFIIFLMFYQFIKLYDYTILFSKYDYFFYFLIGNISLILFILLFRFSNNELRSVHKLRTIIFILSFVGLVSFGLIVTNFTLFSTAFNQILIQDILTDLIFTTLGVLFAYNILVDDKNALGF